MIEADGFAKRDGPLEVAYPRNANCSIVTSAGAAWAWPAHMTQIVASTSEGFVPHELNLCVGFTALVSGAQHIWLEYELGVGAADAEVVIARYTEPLMNGMILPGAGTQNLAAFGRTVPIGPKEIPAGSRLAHRIRCSLIDTAVIVSAGVYVTGYAGGGVPLTYTPYRLRPWLAGVHRATSDISRLGNTYTTVTPASFAGGVYGNWVEDTAVAPSDLIIGGVAYWLDGDLANQASMYLQIGTGAAPDEVPRRVVHCAELGAYKHLGIQQMRYPVFVKKGERVALRGMGGLGVDHFVKLLWEGA
jgi:hypothetical protein